ncbi:MAG: phosphatidylglycerophosphatase A [Acidobacteria bacterium]|nr:phosphatidylglycerophosphatase A [Acidobacteriota bacterium]
MGSGYLRPAPGTIGSAFALVVFVLVLVNQPVWIQAAATVIATAVGTWAATTVSRALSDGDPSEVVVDELAGMWVALIGATTPTQWIVAFFVFRLFDIVKPFPANVAESLPEGIGIMADDIVAGAYTLAVIWLLTWQQIL